MDVDETGPPLALVGLSIVMMSPASRLVVSSQARTISVTTNADAATTRRRNAASTGSRMTVVLCGVIDVEGRPTAARQRGVAGEAQHEGRRIDEPRGSSSKRSTKWRALVDRV